MIPTRASIARALEQLVSGECRYVVEPRIHVYCHAPLVEEWNPYLRRMAWRPGPRGYRVECPGVCESSAAELRARSGNGAWLSQEATIDRVLACLRAPAPSGGRSRFDLREYLATYPVAGARKPTSQPADDEGDATVVLPDEDEIANQPTTQRRLFA